jgi:hypothetical protein
VLVYLSPVRLPPDPTRRHMHRANAWRRLVPGQPDCVGLPRCRASLDFFESLTSSPQALSAAITALLDAATCHAIARSASAEAPRTRSGHPASRRRRDSSKRGRRPLPTPPTGGYHPHARIASCVLAFRQAVNLNHSTDLAHRLRYGSRIPILARPLSALRNGSGALLQRPNDAPGSWPHTQVAALPIRCLTKLLSQPCRKMVLIQST